MRYPDKKAFKQVCTEVSAAVDGRALTLTDIGNVFGPAFWEMLVYCFLDANDAARAVAGAINRLRSEAQESQVAKEANAS